MLENINSMELLNKGKTCFQQNQYKKAQMILQELIDQEPNHTEALFILGNIFHIQGEIGKAIKAFKRVIELDPGHTDASISLSVLYNDIGRYDEAKTIFDSANEKVRKNKASAPVDPHINKKFAQKHRELADLYMLYGRHDEALFEYNKSLGLHPDDLELRIKVAKVYSKKGFISKAFEELKKLKNEYPSYAPARIALGVLYYANGSTIEAQTEWNRVLAQNPHHHEAQMYLNLSKSATETNLNP